MERRWVLIAVAACFAALTAVSLSQGSTFFGVVSGLVTIAAAAATALDRLRSELPEFVDIPRWPLIAAGGAVALLTTALVTPRMASDLARVADRALAPHNAPSSTPSQSAPPPLSPAPTTVLTPTPTPLSAQMVRYCQLSLEFSTLVAQFNAAAWTGKLTAADVQPLVTNAKEALALSPPEVRRAMSVLVGNYTALRDKLSSDKIANITLLYQTTASPLAQAAANEVDTYDNEHCPS